MSPGDSQPHGDGAGQRSNNHRRPPPDSALTEQGLQTLLVAFGESAGGEETGTSSRTSGTTCAPSSSQISTAAYMYACKDPPGASGVPVTACLNKGNVNESANATDAPMPVVDDITPLSLLSQSLAANITTASAGAGWSTNFDQQQAQQTDESSFQWNPSAKNMARASPQGNGVMHVGPSVPHQSAVAVTATVCKAPSLSAPTIDQSIPPFTLEDERRELTTMSIDEIISVEKDLRGLQANLGIMSLSSDPTQREGKVSPPTAKKKKRCRAATPPSKKKGCPPPPPDDAVEATDADILRLDAELNTIDPSYKDAYLHACLHCPSEVNRRDRKAAFLEREGLNASRAALRLVAYWELRLSTFGTDRAFLPMTIDGAIQDEVADMIQHCVVHVMPLTDTSGRAVVFYQPSRRNLAAFPIEREGRALFYLFDSLTLDPTIRRAGFVGVADYRNVSRSQISTKQQRHMKALFEVMPIRIRSCHICHPSPVMSYAYPILKYILGASDYERVCTQDRSSMFSTNWHRAAFPGNVYPKSLGVRWFSTLPSGSRTDPSLKRPWRLMSKACSIPFNNNPTLAPRTSSKRPAIETMVVMSS